jgi:repressor LexA
VNQLTPRQLQVLIFIRGFIAEEGCPPTRADIARGFWFKSANAAEEHLQALERKGAIRLRTGRARGIQIVGAA